MKKNMKNLDQLVRIKNTKSKSSRNIVINEVNTLGRRVNSSHLYCDCGLFKLNDELIKLYIKNVRNIPFLSEGEKS